MKELLPCPFCGQRTLEHYHEMVVPAVQFVYCTTCQMHGPEATTGAEAKRLWNERIPPAQWKVRP